MCGRRSVMMRTMRTLLGLSFVAAVAAGAAAQQREPENVSDAQSLCANGYDAARESGRLSGSGMSRYGRTEVDTNRDGRISKSEFDQACGRNLFKRDESSGQ
jgi:hypothetical protein